MLIREFGKMKPTVEMRGDHVAMFKLFEEMLEALDLSYSLRCRKCNRIDPRNDGCWGNNETTASEWVVECGCTKRSYRNASAPLH